MSRKPLVTIVIATYNQAQYLPQCLRSACSQTYENLEILVCDDHSTDGTEAIMEGVTDSRIVYIRHEGNLGRVANYRKALYEHARGDYVLYLDGDDFLDDKHYIQDAQSLIARSTDMVMVFGKKKVYFEKTGKTLPEVNVDELKSENDGSELFLSIPNGVKFPHISCLYSVKAARDLGFYRLDISSSDRESLMRLMVGNKVGYIDTYVGVWRKHDTNVSRLCDIQTIVENTKFIFSVADDVRSRGAFSDEVIAEWERKMFLKYFYNQIVRFRMLNDSYETMVDRMVSLKPEYFVPLGARTKMCVFRALLKYKPLLRFVLIRVYGRNPTFEDLR